MQCDTKVWVNSPAARALGAASLVAAGVGLLAASAWMSVPFFPVPMTMQTLAVLLIGGVFGPRLGTATVAGYLALGATGAPVFHNGVGGAAVLLGPTGGYLVGFLAMAAIAGLAANWSRRTVATGDAGTGNLLPAGCGRYALFRQAAILAGGVTLAEVALYAVGVPWLALEIGSMREAVEAGMLPFLLGDALKAAVALAALQVTGGLRRRLESHLF